MDPELNAMSYVYESLKSLDRKQMKRIIHWAEDRFGLTPAQMSVELTQQPQQVQTQITVSEAAAGAEPVVKEEKNDIKHYDTALDLFSESNVQKVTSKILLMAAYLQERFNFKEISSYDINFRLKRIGHGVPNISSLLNGILRKKPPLLLQLETEGRTKQARRKFMVTNEGLKVARSYLKE